MKIAVDFYQREMVKLNSSLDDVKIFLDKTTVLGWTTFEEHVEELDKVLTRIETSGFQANIQKSEWAVTQAKYLGHIAYSNGHSLDPKKTQGLATMKEPKNKKQVRRFLGGTNFYHKMWRNINHALVPLI